MLSLGSLALWTGNGWQAAAFAELPRSERTYEQLAPVIHWPFPEDHDVGEEIAFQVPPG